MIRKCYQCKMDIELNATNFRQDLSRKGGLGYICRKCFDINRNEYRETERYKEYRTFFSKFKAMYIITFF